MKKLYHDKNLRIVFGITLVAVMGVASITPAFPKIIRALGISAHQVGLLITVFTVPGVLLTPLLGVLADRAGRKKILVPSLLLFGVAGGCCALARDFHLLLLFRFLQGTGAAALGALNVTIIGDLYAGGERTSAIGYNTSVLSIGTAGYPAAGGLLATFGWYCPFLLPLAAVPLGFLVLFGLENPEPVSEQHIGEYLKSAWQGVKDSRVLGLFALGLVTFIILYGAYLSFFPLLLGHSFGASSLVIGLIMSSMSLTTALTSMQAGRLSKLLSERSLLMTAYSLYCLAMLIMPFGGRLWFFLVPAVIMGAAQGINIPIIVARLTALAPLEYRAAFMSVNGLVLRLGQTAGPPVMAAAFSLWAMPGVFFTAACLSLLMVLLAGTVIE